MVLLFFLIGPCTAEICFKLPRSLFSLEGRCWLKVSGPGLCVCVSSWDGTWFIWVHNCRREPCYVDVTCLFQPFFQKDSLELCAHLKAIKIAFFLIFMKLLLIMFISWLFRAVCSVHQDCLLPFSQSQISLLKTFFFNHLFYRPLSLVEMLLDI